MKNKNEQTQDNVQDKTGEVRDRFFILRMNEHEHRAIRMLAAKKEMSMSEMMRVMLVAAAKKAQVWEEINEQE